MFNFPPHQPARDTRATCLTSVLKKRSTHGLALTLLSLHGVAMADAAKDTTYRMNPLVVAASPLTGADAAVMRSVTVLTREEIQRSPASNLADLLAQVSGVEVLRRGAPGAQADLGIRGSNFEQTLVLVNGVPVHNTQTGHHNLDIPVPLDQIERVEVIKGPGALQYGGSATGGVVNIVTQLPAKMGGRVEAAGGSHDAQKLLASLNGKTDRTYHSLAIQQYTRDSERKSQPTDVDTRSALYTGGAGLGRANLQWGAGTQESDFGAWAFYSAAFPDMREHTRSHMAWLGFTLPESDRRLSSQVYWEGHDDWFRTRIGGTDFINKHKTESFGYKGDLQFDDATGSTAIGTRLERARINSNALKRHERDETSLWLVRHQQLGEKVDMEAGLNRTLYSESGGWWLPSLALGWQVSDPLHLFASAARSARAASYTELYGPRPNVGDPALKPERSDYFETGADLRYQQQLFKVAVYERRTKDRIDWYQPAAPTTQCTNVAYWCAANFDNYKALGQEVSWSWQVKASVISRMEIGYEHQKVSIDERGLPVKYALQIPQQTWRAGLDLSLLANTTLNIQARRPEYAHQSAVTLLAAKLNWSHRQLNAWVEGQNLLDKRVIETGFAPIAGRWLMAGVGYDF